MSDGGAGILALGIDALEGEVAAHHHETAATRDIVPDGMEAIGQHLGFGERFRVQQERIGADIGEDDAVIGRQVLGGIGEVARGDVRGLEINGPAACLERGLEPLHALRVFGGGEAVKTLLVDGVNRPGFPGDQNAFGHEKV